MSCFEEHTRVINQFALTNKKVRFSMGTGIELKRTEDRSLIEFDRGLIWVNHAEVNYLH